MGTVIHRISECPNKSFIFLPQEKTSKVFSQFKPAIKVVLLPDVLTVSRKTIKHRSISHPLMYKANPRHSW